MLRTIGTIITSGGMGKNELSIKDIKARNGFDNLCLAKSKHLSYNFSNIIHFYKHVRKKRNKKFNNLTKVDFKKKKLSLKMIYK